MRLELERWAESPHGTFGTLRSDEFQCYTIERPWFNNLRRESCIPIGVYRCVPSWFHRGGYACYEVLGVPGRTLIKIHAANTVEDVVGCIGVGATLGSVRDRWAILRSRKTLEELLSVLGDNECELVIHYKEMPTWHQPDPHPPRAA